MYITYNENPWHALRLKRAFCVVILCVAMIAVTILASCQPGPTTPPPVVTPTASDHTPTPTSTPTLIPAEKELFHTYARGELLPDMRVPIQRSETGEGGWYTIIGTEEGWAQFLSQTGQPAEIWEPVRWEEEILIGALLGVRSGRGHEITITDLEISGVTVVASVSFVTPPPDQVPSSWVAYPFHFIRVPRIELPLGPVTFDFVAADERTPAAMGQQLASQAADMIDLDILWLAGEAATYPTPTPIPPTLTPEPTFTPTPVPNLRVIGTVLEVMADTSKLHIIPAESDWEYVELLEITSILLEDGQPMTLSQLVPGTRIGVLGYPGEEGSIRAAHIDILSLPTKEPGFSSYWPRSVTLSTIYDGYDLPVSTDSISATLPLTHTFSLTQANVLTRNGFVIVPADYRTMSSLYNDPRYITYPVFISADSILHVSQLFFDRVLRSTEQTHLLPELEMLDREMFDLSWAQYEEMRSSATPAEQRMADTALRNAAYFAVPLSLLDPEFTPPGVISPVVSAELSLIAAGEGITVSPLLDLPGVPDGEKLRVEYDRFNPIGHYAQNMEARYYQALTWHRLITFRLGQREEVRSAILIAHTLNAHSAARILWQRIHTTLAFFQGREASLTPPDCDALLTEVWGEITEITALADEAKMDEFIQAARTLPPPENTMWAWIWDWRPGRPIDRDWVFLSRPYVIDAYVFEQATGVHVGDPENRRELPSSVDLAAVLGSLEAYRIASQVGDADYRNYVAQVDKVRNELAALRPTRWTEELYWNWLHVYRGMIQDKTPSYPNWMRTTAWKRKELQTVFGSWVNVRHDVDPAVEFVPTQEPEGESITPPWGYVEPQPEVYARLAALTRMIIDGLESRLMLSTADRDALLELETWLIFFQNVSRHELTGQALTAEDSQRLAEYGSLIERLTQTAMGGKAGSSDQKLGDGYEAAVAIRVATGVKGEQRIEATGRVDEIYVVVERGRERVLARGGVYSHYEFVWPLQDPLTDALWREIIETGETPPRPGWTSEFVILE